MIRIWFSFAVLAFLIHIGITQWRAMSGKEKWTLTKSVGYSIIVSLLAIAVMSFIVLMF